MSDYLRREKKSSSTDLAISVRVVGLGSDCLEVTTIDQDMAGVVKNSKVRGRWCWEGHPAETGRNGWGVIHLYG